MDFLPEMKLFNSLSLEEQEKLERKLEFIKRRFPNALITVYDLVTYPTS